MNTTTSIRFYIVEDINSDWICDCSTGQAVAEEVHGLKSNETGAQRVDRFDELKARCAALNLEDFSTQRQFGESRQNFASRTRVVA